MYLKIHLFLNYHLYHLNQKNHYHLDYHQNLKYLKILKNLGHHLYHLHPKNH